MTAALTLLLTVGLLRGALCQQYQAFMPSTLKVLKGSCVTIPCSFQIPNDQNPNLDGTCIAIWEYRMTSKYSFTEVFSSTDPQNGRINGIFTGNLLKKDCTTTLYNLQSQYSGEFRFRVECKNRLKYNFGTQTTGISVEDHPETPTLTPSTLKVKEGTSVSLECSAPATCLFLPPNLTWSPGLGEAEEKLQENQNKTKVKISVLNFTASHLHDGQEISCTAVYSKQDGSPQSSVNTSLTAEVTFAPQILSSSDCTRTVNQVNCSCEATGNPAPSLQWTLDGMTVNHSDKSPISNGHLNGIYVSFITMSQTQWKDQFTLVCGSSNSLGSASQRFLFYSLEAETSQNSQDHVILPIFIATTVGLIVLVCALLVLVWSLLRVNRAQKIPHNLPQASDNTSTMAEDQFLPSEEGNEEPIKAEEAIYANSNMLKKPHVTKPSNISATDSTSLPSSAKNSTEDASKSSEEKNEKSEDLVYTTVTWRSRGQKERKYPRDTNLSSSPKQQEAKCTKGGLRRDSVSNTVEMGNLYDNMEPEIITKETECEYAQVKFKDRGDLQK